MKIKEQRGSVKSAAARQRLIATAEVLGRGAQLPPVRHLCGTLGVSVATLDRVLEQLEQEDVIVRRHGSGIFVSENFGRIHIALIYDQQVFHSSGSSFCGQLVERTRERAALLQEQFSFYLDYRRSPDDRELCPPNLKRAILKERLSGAILVGVKNQKLVDLLLSRNIAVVGLGAARCPFHVVIDYRDILRQALDYTERVGGFRPLLLLPFSENDSSHGTLRQECLDIFASRTGQGADASISPDLPGGNMRVSTESKVRELLSHGVKFDSLISLDDTMTLGAYSAFDSLVPDMPIISHSNEGSHVLAVIENRIARLEVSIDELVAAMFALLERQFLKAKGTTPESENPVIRAKLHDPRTKPAAQVTA